MQQASQQIDSRASRRIRIAPGHVLLVASLLEIVGMLHHPSVQMTDAPRAIQEIAQYTTLSAVVHGALLTLMLAIAYGFIDFAVRRGINRPLIRAGALAYACGVLVMVGAGLVSGFIITRLAALLPHTTPVDLQIGFQMLILCGVLNQACANVALVAMSAGMIFWSLDLCASAGLQRWVGLLGCLAGTIPAML